jgi:DNA-binding transcriptional LysR family regulator
MDAVRPGGEVTVPIRPGLLCSNAELAHQAALANMGIAMLSSYLARPNIEAGRLTHILPQYQLPRRDVSVVYPSRKFLPTKVAPSSTSCWRKASSGRWTRRTSRR